MFSAMRLGLNPVAIASNYSFQTIEHIHGFSPMCISDLCLLFFLL